MGLATLLVLGQQLSPHLHGFTNPEFGGFITWMLMFKPLATTSTQAPLWGWN